MLYLITYFLVFILTYIVKVIAQNKMIIDVPNERSSHTVPTPRGGGLAIISVWFLVLSYLFFYENLNKELYLTLLSGILIAVISLIDDIFTIKSSPRLLIQIITAIIVIYITGGIKFIDLGFYTIENTYFLKLISFIGIIWFVNLFNFIDGIDGYVSLGTILIALGLYYFSSENLILLFAIAVFGFLPWNWQKAKIFMGDIGSTVLGFTIVVFLIYLNNKSELNILYGLILTSVFWFDTTFTIIKRLINRENIGKPHKKHAYQRFVRYGLSHQRVTMLAAIIKGLLFLLVLGMNFFNLHEYVLVLFLLVIVVHIGIYSIADKLVSFNE